MFPGGPPYGRGARSAVARGWKWFTTFGPLGLTLIYLISLIFPLAALYDFELGRTWGGIFYICLALGGSIAHATNSTVYDESLAWVSYRILALLLVAFIVSNALLEPYPNQLPPLGEWWMLLVSLTLTYLIAIAVQFRFNDDEDEESIDDSMGHPQTRY